MIVASDGEPPVLLEGGQRGGKVPVDLEGTGRARPGQAKLTRCCESHQGPKPWFAVASCTPVSWGRGHAGISVSPEVIGITRIGVNRCAMAIGFG